MRQAETAENNENSAVSIISTVVTLSQGYATLRYRIAGPVPWKDFPMFILNKGFYLAAFLWLTLSFALGPLSSLGAPVSSGWLNARIAMAKKT
jgi:hypothetical protein